MSLVQKVGNSNTSMCQLENSVNPAVHGYFFELGKDKAPKGEGWTPCSTSCAQDKVSLLTPMPLLLLGYETTLPLAF